MNIPVVADLNYLARLAYESLPALLERESEGKLSLDSSDPYDYKGFQDPDEFPKN